MKEIFSVADVRRACANDRLTVWAAQGVRPGVRAWAHGDAVAVACPHLVGRHRLAVHGPGPEAIEIVAAVGDDLGADYRLLGDPDVIRVVAGGLGGYELSPAFGWMETSGPVLEAPFPDGHRVDWISSAAEADQLLAVAYPGAFARAGVPGVHRWAGARDRAGALVATGAVAWSAPTVGFIAGVATLPTARDTGYGTAVCRFLAEALLARHGTVALMADEWNLPAVRLYRRLGFAWRTIISGRRATS
jgi:GNAT superfamily N-acetyltransferase